MTEKFVSNQSENPMAPIPIPDPIPMKEEIADLGDAEIWYADSGGDGEAVFFLHPATTADPRVWIYQQKAFVDAGYRLIFYARRGYLKSGPNPEKDPGIAAEDLDRLATFLGIDKFHIVSNAAGGACAADYALSHPDRLLSVMVSNNYCGVREGYIFESAQLCRPEQWKLLPRWFREFSCSYLVANPDGAKTWFSLEEEAAARSGLPHGFNSVISDKSLESMKVPALLITGDADMSTPPSLMRMVASHIPGSEMVTFVECGHSPYWEHPYVFNQVVLEFLAKHKG